MKKIYKIKVNGKAYEVELQEITKAEGNVETPAKTSSAPAPKAASGSGDAVKAPMPGTVIDIKVNVGDTVESGQLVAVLEAMKMETEILAPHAGTVTSINTEKGAALNLGDAILFIG